MTVNAKIKPEGEIKTKEFSHALCQIGQCLTKRKKKPLQIRNTLERLKTRKEIECGCVFWIVNRWQFQNPSFTERQLLEKSLEYKLFTLQCWHFHRETNTSFNL